MGRFRKYCFRNYRHFRNKEGIYRGNASKYQRRFTEYIPLASISGGVITDERPTLEIDSHIVKGILKLSKSSDIASATTTDLSTSNGNYAHITGTTTITALGTLPAGTTITCVFDDILTLTHNSTSFKLPTLANITTAS
jgi:hypothetical protein